MDKLFRDEKTGELLSAGALQLRLPEVGAPHCLEPQELAERGFDVVKVIEPPALGENQAYGEPELVQDGDQLTLVTPVISATAEDIAAIAAAQVIQQTQMAWEKLRAARDLRLAAATAILDRHRNQRDFGLATTLTDAEATAWATYAQALRDLPEETSDPAAPEWPVEPGSVTS